MFQTIENVRVWGEPQQSAVSQAVQCAQHGNVKQILLMADHHKGYSLPIGGVAVYDGQISPSGVGFDIACGNKAVRTNLKYEDVQHRIANIMDDIAANIVFGIGGESRVPVDHELFDDDDWHVFKQFGQQEHDQLKAIARKQLGTVGSGNHYVDIFVEEATGDIWVANHFGSRGFGHRTASGFLNVAAGEKFGANFRGGGMDEQPTLIDMDSELGELYYRAMNLAGRYAYAGRDEVMRQVLDILQAEATFEVHSHHNFAWKEEHGGQAYIVVRKGATPLAPGQMAFIGGSMADMSVIVKGKDSEESQLAYYSTVHGAGRVMSRTEAAGKMNWRTRKRSGGQISVAAMRDAVQAYGVELRGAGTDESPFVYKKLEEVLDAHKETMEILHMLRPIGVCMAGE